MIQTNLVIIFIVVIIISKTIKLVTEYILLKGLADRLFVNLIVLKKRCITTKLFCPNLPLWPLVLLLDQILINCLPDRPHDQKILGT